MNDKKIETEQLRQEILDDIYAGAFSGMPSMLLEEDKVQNASYEELKTIAERYGIK